MSTKVKESRKLWNGIELISWIPAIITIIIIWYMSSQTGTVSTDTSAKVTSDIAMRSFFGINLGFLDDPELMDVLHSIVRSCAHIGEYAVLALCVCIACRVCKVRGRFRQIYALMICGIISLSDEMLQVFVPDRYGDLSDIVCDMAGAAFSVIIVTMFERILHLAASKKKSETAGDGKYVSKRYVFDIAIDNLSFDEAIQKIDELASDKNGKHYIVTPNVDHIVKLEKDSLFKEIYDHADMVVTDGTPLMWMMESIGYPIREKVTGADMLPKVCEMAAKNKKSIFILGAKPGVAKEAENKLRMQYKGLKIVGTMSPKSGFDKEEQLIKEVIAAVNAKSPDILVLALGSPKQEKFIYKYREQMNFGVALPFGAAVDFAADNVKRAPLFIRKIGLEWLYRFLQEPGRLFKRYFVEDIKIFILFWKYRRQMMEQNENIN